MRFVRIALLPTCVVDTVAPQVGAAAVRVLRKAGHDVVVPAGATCCGQPAWNAGFSDAAAAVARTTLAALSAALADADMVCVPAGSCATMIRVFWPELFHLAGDDEAATTARTVGARTREFSELLTEDGIDALPPAHHAAAVGYHHSCHMLRELRIHDAPEALLAAVDGCEQVAWDGADRCCGFGGLFSVKQPETSVAMADDKLDTLATTGATELVGCDASCLLHLEARLRHRGDATTVVRHLAEVLDEATDRTDQHEARAAQP